MKKSLSLLVAFVFLQTQSWALSGGPQFSQSQTSIVGTYAGVLIPENEANSNAGGSSAAIGLFSVAVADIGPATGAAVVFVDGVAYNGNMIGIADPQRSTLQAIVEATSNFDIVTVVQATTPGGTATQVRTNIFAQGSLTASIAQTGGQAATGISAIRLTGTASLDLFSELRRDGTPKVSNTVTFEVDGFKQSDTATAVTITFTPGGPNTGGGGGTGS